MRQLLNLNVGATIFVHGVQKTRGQYAFELCVQTITGATLKSLTGSDLCRDRNAVSVEGKESRSGEWVYSPKPTRKSGKRRKLKIIGDLGRSPAVNGFWYIL